MWIVVLLVSIFIGLIIITYWLIHRATTHTNAVIVGKRNNIMTDTPYGRVCKNISQPTNQYSCNSCWAIACCQTTTDRMRINGILDSSDELNYYAYHDIIVDGTPEEDGCGSGILLSIGMNKLVSDGAPLMSESIDRTFNDTPIPSDISSTRYHIKGWKPVYDIKTELEREGPVIAVINLYDSFSSFVGSGIYRPSSGESLDSSIAHMVSIVGYDDRDNTWIIRNSYGPTFGHKGYCKIKRGDTLMGVETSVYAPILQ